MGSANAVRSERPTERTVDTSPSWQQLSLLATVVAASRLAFGIDRRMFHLVPDEAATLAMARWLSGGTKWNMFVNSTWRPGPATLFAPVFWLTDDPETIIRSILVINAVLGGIAAVVLARLASRFADISAVGSCVTAAIVALTPASLSASAHVWAEPLVTLTFLLAVSSSLSFVLDHRTSSGFAAVAWACVGYTSHGRMLPLVVLVAALTVGVSLGRGKLREALLIAAACVIMVIASQRYSAWLVETLWVDPGEFNTVGSTLRRFSNPVAVLDAALGQLWYLLVSSVGMFGIGAVVLVRTAMARGETHQHNVSARVLIYLTVPLLGVSALFMSDRPRTEHLVYGRYNDAIVWPVVLLGLWWVAETASVGWERIDRRSKWIVVGVTLACLETGLLIQLLHNERLAEAVGVREMVIGLMPFNGSATGIRAFVITIAAVGVFLAVVVGARFGRRALTVGAAIVLLAAGLHTHHVVAGDRNFLEPASGVSDIGPELLPAGAPLTYVFVPDPFATQTSYLGQLFYAHAYQWYLPDHEFVLTFDEEAPAGSLVIAPVDTPALIEADALILWEDPDVGLALWRTADEPTV